MLKGPFEPYVFIIAGYVLFSLLLEEQSITGFMGKSETCLESFKIDKFVLKEVEKNYAILNHAHLDRIGFIVFKTNLLTEMSSNFSIMPKTTRV